MMKVSIPPSPISTLTVDIVMCDSHRCVAWYAVITLLMMDSCFSVGCVVYICVCVGYVCRGGGGCHLTPQCRSIDYNMEQSLHQKILAKKIPKEKNFPLVG
jgi:hypothetical protein